MYEMEHVLLASVQGDPICTPPTEKVTVPSGVPPPDAGSTVAVKVTGLPITTVERVDVTVVIVAFAAA